MKKNKDYSIIIALVLVNLVIIWLFLVVATTQFNKKIKDIQSEVFTPVVIERTDDDTIKDERTRELVQQAYGKLDTDSWFDFAYKVDFGSNDYGQLLIFVTFYYSKVNDPKNYKVTVCNYYQAPDVNEWEVVYGC